MTRKAKTHSKQGFRLWQCFSLLLVAAFCCALSLYAQDENARRKRQDENANRPTDVPSNLNRKRPRPKPTPARVNWANVVLMVSPSESTVWINGEQKPVDNAGGVPLKVKPGSYTVIVRHPDYRDDQRTLDLKAGDNPSVLIDLELLKGTLTVRPSVNGAEIQVWSVARNQSVGSYVGYLNNVAFPPGDYDITVSKTGYQDSTRTVTLKAGGSVEIEPTLHPTPPPKPTPKPPPRPMNALVEIEGKYLIVHLSGTSADDSIRSGSINVTVSKNISGFPSVIGTLNGSPCRIEFFRQENIDQWSLIETPSPSNQYSRIVVRIKPKDSKRPASFVINWIAVNSSSQFLDGPAGRETLSEAVPISKVLPTVPAIVRSLNVQGVVSVSVVIDERGNVISAKALDGPAALRQPAEDAARRWKFRPATRNGIATQVTQTIRFSFER